jgi:hypothetical protein
MEVKLSSRSEVFVGVSPSVSTIPFTATSNFSERLSNVTGKSFNGKRGGHEVQSVRKLVTKNILVPVSVILGTPLIIVTY